MFHKKHIDHSNIHTVLHSIEWWNHQFQLRLFLFRSEQCKLFKFLIKLLDAASVDPLLFYLYNISPDNQQFTCHNRNSACRPFPLLTELNWTSYKKLSVEQSRVSLLSCLVYFLLLFPFVVIPNPLFSCYSMVYTLSFHHLSTLWNPLHQKKTLWHYRADERPYLLYCSWNEKGFHGDCANRIL